MNQKLLIKTLREMAIAMAICLQVVVLYIYTTVALTMEPIVCGVMLIAQIGWVITLICIGSNWAKYCNYRKCMDMAGTDKYDQKRCRRDHGDFADETV